MHLDARWVGFTPWDSFPLGICLLRVCRCLWGFTSFHHEPVYSSIKRNKAGLTVRGASYWSHLLNEGGLSVNWHFMGKFLLLLYGLSCLSGFKMNIQRIGWQRVGGERREETDVSWLTLRASWQIILKSLCSFGRAACCIDSNSLRFSDSNQTAWRCQKAGGFVPCLWWVRHAKALTSCMPNLSATPFPPKAMV